MGFSNTLTGFFLFFLIFFALFTLIEMINNCTILLARFLSTYPDYAFNTVKIEKSNYIVIDNNTVCFNLTNNGNTLVRISEFKFADVIAIYENNNSEKIVEWIPYMEVNNTAYWIIADKFNDNINPITNTSGIWDPGETIKIKVKLSYPLSEAKKFNLVTIGLRNRNADFSIPSIKYLTLTNRKIFEL